jgi:hypothetical protein
MYTVNRKIIDTFLGYKEDPGFTPITGLTFTKLLAINGATADPVVVSVTEDTVTSGVYYLTYTPTLTGSHHINLYNSAAVFEADYYVTSGAGEVWNYSISGAAVTDGSMGQALSATWQVQTGKWEMIGNQLNLWDKDGINILRKFQLFDINGNPSLTGVVKRVPF